MVPTEQVSRASVLGLLVLQEVPPRAQLLRRAGALRAPRALRARQARWSRQAQRALQQETMAPQVAEQEALKESRELEREPQLQPLEGQGPMAMALPSWPPQRALEASTLCQGFFFSAPRESKSA